MKYKFCGIRIDVTKYDVTFAAKEGSNPPSPVARHCSSSTVQVQLKTPGFFTFDSSNL